ncbi:MAG: ATP-binding cassette domain-containing protein [Rhodobacterales bacterium]|nr:ATP-binding cassette domain-containing protein [Rhodobacterales bacterium]
MALLEVRGLLKAFGKNAPVITNVNLDVQAGEVLGLIGPNGGGKSTLMMLMAGLVTPDSGTVQLDGVDTTNLALQSSGSVGLITAVPGLYPLLTGWENLHYFGGLNGLSEAEVNQRASDLLDGLDLGDQLERQVKEYSSGMQQKVSLVRALLMNPRLLLLDEPTSNLDPLSTHTIHMAVRQQADAGVAVVLCTHDLHAAESICDRVAVMQRTIRGNRALTGERATPPHGQLFQMYQEHVQ